MRYGDIKREGFINGDLCEQNISRLLQSQLQEVLGRSDTPHVIDYLSLDVEVAEIYIMKNFPTDERPDREHLETNGFKLMGDISGFGETLWIHNDYMSGLDLGVMDSYKSEERATDQKEKAVNWKKSLDTLLLRLAATLFAFFGRLSR
jgi:hypothetical protein